MVAVGSETRLHTIINKNVAFTTGYNPIGADNAWTFAQFNDYLIATAPNNAPQYLSDIDTDTSWSALPGSPPEARVCGRVGNFLVLGNLTGLSLPSSIQWSAENNPTDWPTPGTADARVKSSGRAALQPEYGSVTGITGDRYPLIFQERGIFRMTPVGPPDHFNVRDAVSEARGCIAPHSIVTVGFITYFLAHDGFYATDGNQLVPIASSRVNQWFAEEVSETDRQQTQGAVAWEHQCVIWNFKPKSNTTDYRRQIIYSLTENRWSTASLTNQWIVDDKIGGVTLEQLDGLFPSGLESVTPPLDDNFWKARSRVLSAFAETSAGTSKIYALRGSNLEATFETGDAQPAPGRRVSINGIYPVVENAAANTTASLITREYKGGAGTESSPSAINVAGMCPQRGDGRWARAKMIIPAGASWEKAQGAQVEFRVSGKR